MPINFSELYVISDLHMGGPEGFQIFRQGPNLAKFIDNLRQEPVEGGGLRGLVINGDSVDFLAAEKAVHFDLDPASATRKLEAIFDDAAFSPVWDALNKFVGTPERRLIITLGNHDPELALPPVKEALVQRLTNDDDAARGRLILAFDGIGFRCKVKGKNVLCVHGNEVDAWNVIDYASLRQLAQSWNWGSQALKFDSNGGTMMVIDVMNSIKQDYRWVDLLKPEKEATVPALVAIDPSKMSAFRNILPSVSRLGMTTVRMQMGLLSAKEAALQQEALAPVSPELEMQRILAQTAGGFQAQKKTAKDLQGEMHKLMAAGRDAIEIAENGGGDRQLGIFGDTWNKIWSGGKEMAEDSRKRLLREYLRKHLLDDHTFDPKQPDETFKDLEPKVTEDIDYIVTGHTHLRKDLPRTSGRGTYFNSGTWVRLMRLDSEVLKDDAKYNALWKVLNKKGDINSLDQNGYVIHELSVVRIKTNADGSVEGALTEFNEKNGQLDVVR